MLEKHPDVAQAAVVPIDDEIKGQKPVAFVIPKAGPHARPEDAIKQFALANAPAYQHPRFVWFVDDLPLASTNKIDRGDAAADGGGEAEAGRVIKLPSLRAKRSNPVCLDLDCFVASLLAMTIVGQSTSARRVASGRDRPRQAARARFRSPA